MDISFAEGLPHPPPLFPRSRCAHHCADEWITHHRSTESCRFTESSVSLSRYQKLLTVLFLRRSVIELNRYRGYSILLYYQHCCYMSVDSTTCMNRNVGSIDQSLRTAVGAIAGVTSIGTLAGTVPLPEALSPVLGVVALMMLATATVGTCPIYSIFGVDSCSRSSSGA